MPDFRDIKQAEARKHDARVLAQLIAAGDSGLRPGELAGQTNLPRRTLSRAAARLKAAGLARRDGKRRIWATALAQSQTQTDAPSFLPALQASIACFPAEAQRAFVRLLLSGITARWHLSARYPDGWGGFVLLGPTKTGKTSIAQYACRIFSLDSFASIRPLMQETPGSIFGRRVQTAGKQWRLETSRLLELPFACLDEWDKADEDVRRAAGKLLLGQSVAECEGERVRMRPVVLVCLNRPESAEASLHEAWLRRSVVLDTAMLAPLLADVDEAMRRLFASSLPRLELERLKPQKEALPEEVRRELRRVLRENLNDDGWRLCDIEAISRLALGRIAFCPEAADPLQAAYATALDYLACASTVNQTRSGFGLRLKGWLKDTGLPVSPAEAERESQARRQTAIDAASRNQAERLRFVAEREAKAEEAAGLRRQMGRAINPDGKAIARALAEAAGQIKGCRSGDALEAAGQAALPWLNQARSWLAAREQTKRQHALAVQQARQARKIQQQQRRELLTQWVAVRHALAALMPYASDADLMTGLARLGLVERQRHEPQPEYEWRQVTNAYGLPEIQRVKKPKGFWQWLGDALTGPIYFWVVKSTGERMAEADALRLWASAYRQADENIVQLGGRSRACPIRQRAARQSQSSNLSLPARRQRALPPAR